MENCRATRILSARWRNSAQKTVKPRSFWAGRPCFVFEMRSQLSGPAEDSKGLPAAAPRACAAPWALWDTIFGVLARGQRRLWRGDEVDRAQLHDGGRRGAGRRETKALSEDAMGGLPERSKQRACVYVVVCVVAFLKLKAAFS